MKGYREFMRLVWRMMNAQKKYFEEQSSSNLRKAKVLERQVWAWMKNAGIEAEKISQMQLLPDLPKTDPEIVSRNGSEGS